MWYYAYGLTLVHSHILAFVTIDATNDSAYHIKAFLWLISLGCMLFIYSKIPGFVRSRAALFSKPDYTQEVFHYGPRVPLPKTALTSMTQPSTATSTQLLLLDLAWYGTMALLFQSLLHATTLLANSPLLPPMLLYKDWQKD
jgi:hypothetical protein